MTARRWQGKKGGGQWIRGKCFDTFLPLGPYLVPKSAVDLTNTSIRTWINGDLVQVSCSRGKNTCFWRGVLANST